MRRKVRGNNCNNTAVTYSFGEMIRNFSADTVLKHGFDFMN
jgi:hypothetical protein